MNVKLGGNERARKQAQKVTRIFVTLKLEPKNEQRVASPSEYFFSRSISERWG